MASQEDSVEVVAATQKERLRSLGAAQELSNTPDEDSARININIDDDNESTEETNTSVKFRNYNPHDKKLKEGKLKPGPTPKFDDIIAAAMPSPLETKKDPLKDLIPKSQHYELKRDAQERLDKLERRTQKALTRIMEQESLKQLE